MELERALREIKEVDRESIERAEKRWLSIAKPLYSLGELERIISRISGMKRNERFEMGKRALIIMCSDNGIVEEGVTQTGQNVTAVVTENFKKGEACVCYMAEIAGADIFPVDLGVCRDIEGITDKKIKIGYGTKNMTKGPAMTRDNAVRAIEIGIEKVTELKNRGYGIIATGEMGIGNTAASSAVTSVLTGKEAEKITGRGSGLSDEGLERKIKAIKKAVEVNKPDRNDVIDVLAKVGGFDICGLVGVYIGGALCGMPIIADGFISCTAALAAVRLCGRVREYIIVSHISKEPAGRMIIEELGFKAIIDGEMCLGEGSGAVALMPIIDMAYNVYMKMISFDTWSGEEDYRRLK